MQYATPKGFRSLTIAKLKKSKSKESFDFIKSKFNLEQNCNLLEINLFSIHLKAEINAIADSFLRYLELNWQNRYERFLTKNADWLKTEFLVTFKKDLNLYIPKPYVDCQRTTQFNRRKEIICHINQYSPKAAKDAIKK